METIGTAFYSELKKGGGGGKIWKIEPFLHLADSLISSSSVFIYCNVTITKSYWYTYDI